MCDVPGHVRVCTSMYVNAFKYESMEASYVYIHAHIVCADKKQSVCVMCLIMCVCMPMYLSITKYESVEASKKTNALIVKV